MSYINIIGNGVTQTSYTSYAAYTLDNTMGPTPGFINLAWSAQFIDTIYIVAGWIDITAVHAGVNNVVLPDARDASTGEKVTFNNPGINTYNVTDNNGTTLVSLTAGQFWEFILIDNTTKQGTWRVVRTPGSTGITSIDAVAQNNVGQSVGNIVITGTPGLPITTAGTINVNLGNDLQALTTFAGLTGFAVRTAVNTWALRTITGTPPIVVAANPLNPNNIQVSITTGQYVVSVGLDVPNITDAANVVITNSPITGSGFMHLALASDLRALVNFGAGTGIPVRTAPGTWTLIPQTSGTRVRFDGVGVIGAACTIISQSNVASVTHTAVGVYTIVFTAPLAADTYVVSGMAGDDDSYIISYSGTLTTGFAVNVFLSNTAALTDAGDVSISIS